MIFTITETNPGEKSGFYRHPMINLASVITFQLSHVSSGNDCTDCTFFVIKIFLQSWNIALLSSCISNKSIFLRILVSEMFRLRTFVLYWAWHLKHQITTDPVEAGVTWKWTEIALFHPVSHASLLANNSTVGSILHASFLINLAAQCCVKTQHFRCLS